MAQTPASSGKSALRQVLLSMPDSLIPQLSVSDRQDFLDYDDSGMEGRVANRLGGVSTMPQFNENSLTIRTSSVGFVQIGMFEQKKGSGMICVVNTVNAGCKDSRLAFYDMNWKALPVDRLIEQPQFQDFLLTETVKSDSMQVLLDAFKVKMSSIAIVPDGLAFTCSSINCMDSIGAARFEPFFKSSPILYRWTGKRFVKQR